MEQLITRNRAPAAFEDAISVHRIHSHTSSGERWKTALINEAKQHGLIEENLEFLSLDIFANKIFYSSLGDLIVFGENEIEILSRFGNYHDDLWMDSIMPEMIFPQDGQISNNGMRFCSTEQESLFLADGGEIQGCVNQTQNMDLNSESNWNSGTNYTPQSLLQNPNVSGVYDNTHMQPFYRQAGSPAEDTEVDMGKYDEDFFNVTLPSPGEAGKTIQTWDDPQTWSLTQQNQNPLDNDASSEFNNCRGIYEEADGDYEEIDDFYEELDAGYEETKNGNERTKRKYAKKSSMQSTGSTGPVARKRNPSWSDNEMRMLFMSVKKIHSESQYADITLFKHVSADLANHNIMRNANACKMQWNRKGRKQFGYDERKRGDVNNLQTSSQVKRK